MQCYKYMHIAYLRIHTQLFELLCPCNSLIEGVNFTHFFIVNGSYWTSAKLLKQCYKVVCGAPRRNFKVGCIPLMETPLLKTENPPLKTPNLYALTFLTTNFIVFFAENMVKLIVKNVKAEPLGKLMECIVNRLNISQMGLRGF